MHCNRNLRYCRQILYRRRLPVRRKKFQPDGFAVSGAAAFDELNMQGAGMCCKPYAQWRWRGRLLGVDRSIQKAQGIAGARRQVQALQCAMIERTARRLAPHQHRAAFTRAQD